MQGVVTAVDDNKTQVPQTDPATCERLKEGFTAGQNYIMVSVTQFHCILGASMAEGFGYESSLDSESCQEMSNQMGCKKKTKDIIFKESCIQDGFWHDLYGWKEWWGGGDMQKSQIKSLQYMYF